MPQKMIGRRQTIALIWSSVTNIQSDTKRIVFHCSFLSLLSLGPPLPKAMHGLSMVTINNDGFVFGGYDGDDRNKEVFKISCANEICQWSTTDKVVDNGKYLTLAIPISSSLCKSN